MSAAGERVDTPAAGFLRFWMLQFLLVYGKIKIRGGDASWNRD